MVEGNHVVYRISAPSPEEKDEWMKSIRCAAGCGDGERPCASPDGKATLQVLEVTRARARRVLLFLGPWVGAQGSEGC